MHKFLSIIVPFVLLSGSLQADEIGFKNELPTEKGFEQKGDIKATLIEDEGRKMVHLDDASATDFLNFSYLLSDDQADRIALNGFTLETRIRQISGALPIVLRLKGWEVIVLNFWKDEDKGSVTVSVYNQQTKKTEKATLASGDGYIALKMTLEPDKKGEGGKLAVSINNGEASFSVPLPRGDHGRQIITLGHSEPQRTGHTAIDYFRFTIPE